MIHTVWTQRPPVGGSCFFNNQSGWAWPSDAIPNDFDAQQCAMTKYPGGLYNANYKVGKSYTNKRFGFKVSVISKNTTGYVVSITNTKQAQTISQFRFASTSLAIGTYTKISAAASSGLKVSFKTLTPKICNLSSGQVLGISSGICKIQASQSGNGIYNPAPAVQKSIIVK